jgi:hypothetical protein
MKSESELRALIEQKMRDAMPGMIEAMTKFQREPNAKTFKDAENIPDSLVGKALDEVVGELLKETAKTPSPVTNPPGSQKNVATGNGQ